MLLIVFSSPVCCAEAHLVPSCGPGCRFLTKQNISEMHILALEQQLFGCCAALPSPEQGQQLALAALNFLAQLSLKALASSWSSRICLGCTKTRAGNLLAAAF